MRRDIPQQARPADPEHDVVFYDGNCGLCHRLVRFILKNDAQGVFRFAPLDSDALRASFSPEQRKSLPDSVIIVTKEGRVLTHSPSTLYVLRRLGGGWRVIGAGLQVVPRIISDAAYDGIARIRHRLFKR